MAWHHHGGSIEKHQQLDKRNVINDGISGII